MAIKIYSRIGCAPCKTAKQYLQFIGLAYEETLDHNKQYTPTFEFSDGEQMEGWGTNVRIRLNQIAKDDKAYIQQV